MIEPYRSSMQLMRWTVTIAMAMYSAIIITVKQNSMVTFTLYSDNPVGLSRKCNLLMCFFWLSKIKVWVISHKENALSIVIKLIFRMTLGIANGRI